jgi:predicted protein tyrosine phosphatase
MEVIMASQRILKIIEDTSKKIDAIKMPKCDALENMGKFIQEIREARLLECHCTICGDYHENYDSMPLSCKTGDGV